MRSNNDLLGEQIEDRLEHLLLVVEAMWELLRDHHGLTDADLLQRVRKLDCQDGVADGRHRQPPGSCSCGAKYNRVTHRCDFCGATAPVQSVFDFV